MQWVLSGHEGAVNGVCAFTLDGRTFLASCGGDRTVRIWDPAVGTQHPAMFRHTSAVRSVSAFSLDSRALLAIGGNEQAVRIWEPATGAQCSAPGGHTGWVRSVSAYTLNSRTLIATGSDDRTRADLGSCRRRLAGIPARPHRRH